MHTYISLLCQLKVHGGNDNPVAMSTRNIQLLVSSAALPLREKSSMEWYQTDYRNGAAHIHGKSIASFGARKKESVQIKKVAGGRVMLKPYSGHRKGLQWLKKKQCKQKRERGRER